MSELDNEPTALPQRANRRGQKRQLVDEREAERHDEAPAHEHGPENEEQEHGVDADSGHLVLAHVDVPEYRAGKVGDYKFECKL